MKLLVVAVGERMPGWVDLGFGDYAGRMPRGTRIELIEIKPAPRRDSRTVEQMLAAEATRIEAAIPAGALRVILDERGRDLTTTGLASLLEGWIAGGRDVALVIGGPDGTAPALRSSADLLLRLSSLTLPHGLARVILAESLYRAVTVLNHHPYHRA